MLLSFGKAAQAVSQEPTDAADPVSGVEVGLNFPKCRLTGLYRRIAPILPKSLCRCEWILTVLLCPALGYVRGCEFKHQNLFLPKWNLQWHGHTLLQPSGVSYLAAFPPGRWVARWWCPNPWLGVRPLSCLKQPCCKNHKTKSIFRPSWLWGAVVQQAKASSMGRKACFSSLSHLLIVFMCVWTGRLK